MQYWQQPQQQGFQGGGDWQQPPQQGFQGGGGGFDDVLSLHFNEQNDDGGYLGQQGPPRYFAPPDYTAPILWSLHGTQGVTGFAGVVEKYCALPIALRSSDEYVLSRKHMLQPRLTVSRIQAIAKCEYDGSAALISIGKGPTLVRQHNGAGQWITVHKGQSIVLSPGDQVSLDCNDPDAAVFTCLQGGYDQGYGAQQQGYGAQQGYGGGGGGYGSGGGGGWGGQQQGG